MLFLNTHKILMKLVNKAKPVDVAQFHNCHVKYHSACDVAKGFMNHRVLYKVWQVGMK